MWGKKKALSPDVKEAIGRRDELMSKVKDAVKEVDRLQDELLSEYQDAEEHLQEHRWS